MDGTPPRRWPIGAELAPGGGVHFRVWAPRRTRVEVVFEGDQPGPVGLHAEGNGYFSGLAGAAGAGSRYRFRLDGDGSFPDPMSRFQPEGPHGPSQVVDPRAFRWTDADWRGASIEGQVIYELHVGTFTREGTWAAAIRELPYLKETGITVIEVMPLADFTGRFGWGYDGVNMFAPTRLYGQPDDVRRFVDRAHALGMAVIHDVVYNHFGPDGNYTGQFSEDYLTDKHKNEWGDSINFDAENSGPVREFFVTNAGYWVDEYHFDGLRLDATQAIMDDSKEHVLLEISKTVREAAKGRKTIIVAENESQHTRLVRSRDQGGYELDGLWNDDFHHAAFVATTAHNEAYYTDYNGTPQEFISAMKWGYLYQGQRYRWQRKRRGTPALDLPPCRFVTFIENHDQVANSGRGERRHHQTSPGKYRAVTALLLLGPGTPMLFQGQEYASDTPFLYFADHGPELAKLVAKGRAEFLAQFRSLALVDTRTILTDPADPKTFERCQLDVADRTRFEKNAHAYALHRDLLDLRRTDPVFAAQRRRGLDGAVLSADAFVLRFFDETHGDRLVVVNFGRDVHLDPAPEPFLAPPAGMKWLIRWSSESLRYGGLGTAPLDTEDNWRIPGEAAVVLTPAPLTPAENPTHG